jgi:hypothetical protein
MNSNETPDWESEYYSELSTKEKQLIAQIISPLEAAATRYMGPFFYTIDHQPVYFNDFASKELREGLKARISIVHNRQVVETHCVGVPIAAREAFEDPREVMGLPNYLRNHLCNMDCHNMLRIKALGRLYFEKQTELGPKSIQTLMELFARHGCEHLFK